MWRTLISRLTQLAHFFVAASGTRHRTTEYALLRSSAAPRTALNCVSRVILWFGILVWAFLYSGSVFGADAPRGEEEEQVTARDSQIKNIQATAALLMEGRIDTVLSQIHESPSRIDERFVSLTYLKDAEEDLNTLSENAQRILSAFVAYGVDDNSRRVGRGVRAAVFYSYRAAYRKLPQAEEEIVDMIKIVNGRFPNMRNGDAQQAAQTQFKRIYKRVGVIENSNDAAALMIMAYGLQQEANHRNLSSEQRGLKTFADVYGILPRTITEWNIVNAITYSGAVRKADSDGDMLSDDDERQRMTDPSNPDTDGDGYPDGLEVEHGYSPLERAQ
ncbi:hypothetical protein HY732_00425 [Candidatus Uhrbacteria bacterium]|nr:hypothetical protein [Candidatus Uhrbacteria bacterium]